MSLVLFLKARNNQSRLLVNVNHSCSKLTLQCLFRRFLCEMNAESKLPINYLFYFKKAKKEKKERIKDKNTINCDLKRFFSGSNGKKNKKNTPEVQFFTYLALCCHQLTHEINNKQNIMAKATCPRC